MSSSARSSHIIVRCIVPVVNSNGEPDLFFIKVRLTQEEYENGWHYDYAYAAAERNGYTPAMVDRSPLVFDEFDHAGNAMMILGVWESVSVIDLENGKTIQSE